MDEGEFDANYFQHQPYLDNFNEEKGSDLVSAAKIHYEPLGIYPGASEDLENIKDGAKIAVPMMRQTRRERFCFWKKMELSH